MAALSVEHLKVMAALTVEPAYASSSIYLFAPQISQKMVEHLKVLISRAPKGDGGLNSRACYRIQLTYLPLK